jgi:hypothetical protein
MVIVIPSLKVRGMALYPFILLRESADRHDPCLINHELIHHRQQVEMLVLPFYLWYLTEYLLYRMAGLPHFQAYLNISFEKEAYLNDFDMGYLHRRRPWQFLRYARSPLARP